MLRIDPARGRSVEEGGLGLSRHRAHELRLLLQRAGQVAAQVISAIDDEHSPSVRSKAGVDCSRVHVSPSLHTALCTITTDEAHAQIVTFYPGAMSEARSIDVAALHAEAPVDLLLIGPDDPEAMLRHTQAAREVGLPFAADPSQQLAWADGDLIRQLIEGAAYLFTNDYEAALVEQKTGWSSAEVKAAVGVQVITRGKDGVTVADADGNRVDVDAISGIEAVDPTGVGDSFRGGFLAGLARGSGPHHVRAGRLHRRRVRRRDHRHAGVRARPGGLPGPPGGRVR
ncbi:PfkB family carbohydrate kinase [Aeromicrobium sp. Sec7.5]|uniref:PfkB family carbohydrate kinase n=1 Tax=Aeromicrobium sp. Sec7.5 TaxID=3121276 RepID=UPI002FE436A6